MPLPDMPINNHPFNNVAAAMQADSQLIPEPDLPENPAFDAGDVSIDEPALLPEPGHELVTPLLPSEDKVLRENRAVPQGEVLPSVVEGESSPKGTGRKACC